MAKLSRISMYGDLTRKLQRRKSFERVQQTWKTANVWMYLGSRVNQSPDLSDVQVTTFGEVPDRAYSSEPIEINIMFDPLPEQIVDYSQFGVIDPAGVDQIIRVHVNSWDEIGRPLVEGDVLDVPFFKQESHKAMWEVTDVDRGQEFEKFYAVVKLRELEDSRKTREVDIDGSYGDSLDAISAAHEAYANDQVKHEGVDTTPLDIEKTHQPDEEGYDGRQNDRSSFLDDFDGDLL